MVKVARDEDGQLNVPAKRKSRTDPKIRFLRFLLLAVPGAMGVTIGGIGLGFVVSGISEVATLAYFPWQVWVMILASPVWLLCGLGKLRQPLYLFIFVPMPVLMAAGFYLAHYRGPEFGWIALYGLAAPVIAYFPVTQYYNPDSPDKPSRPPSLKRAG
jgi:hypothetical protein